MLLTAAKIARVPRYQQLREVLIAREDGKCPRHEAQLRECLIDDSMPRKHRTFSPTPLRLLIVSASLPTADGT